jgi:hypothetical protein
MQFSVYTVLSVFSTWFMILVLKNVIMRWRDWQIWLNFMLLDNGRVEDQKESWWEEKTIHHEKLELKRSLFASQLIIPDTISMTSKPAGNNTNMLISKPNYVSYTLVIHCILIWSISFPSSNTISFSSPTQLSLRNIKLSHSSLAGYTMIMS